MRTTVKYAWREYDESYGEARYGCSCPWKVVEDMCDRNVEDPFDTKEQAIEFFKDLAEYYLEPGDELEETEQALWTLCEITTTPLERETENIIADTALKYQDG
tara:strand:+ start:198 stop:506 length:309 start_codon:yes stop_codon:yes gene_type:complete